MALWQYCRETAHNAAVLRLSAKVPEAARFGSLFKLCAGESASRNLIRRHCRLQTILHGLYWQGMGRAEQCRKVCQYNPCFGKSSSFATNARLKSRVHPKYIEVPCSPYAPQERLVAAPALRNACHWHFLFFSRLYNIICFNFKPALCGKLTNGIIYIFFKIYRVIME